MAPSSLADAGTAGRGIERVRARLLTALHVGRLAPGDRVPSVRRLAELTGMNRKTVHRAYAELAREGLLESRPGSGTFVREGAGGAQDPSGDQLVAAVRRIRAEARGLDLEPETFSAFLAACFEDGIEGLPVAVAECNAEQRGLISRDLAAGLRLQPVPLPIRDLERGSPPTLRNVAAVVTTHCHWSQVCRRLRPLGVPVYAVSLEPSFPQLMARLAGLGPVVLVVADAGFSPVFLRLLRQMSVPDETLARFEIVSPEGAAPALRNAPDGAFVWVSPTVRGRFHERVPLRHRRVPASWRVRNGSLERLRAGLALLVARAAHAAE